MKKNNYLLKHNSWIVNQVWLSTKWGNRSGEHQDKNKQWQGTKIDFIQKYNERNYTALLTVTYFVICVKIRNHADKNKYKAYEILEQKITPQ